MRKIVLLVAAVSFALMPVAALAQEVEVEIEVELGDLGDAIGDLTGETAEEWTAALDAVKSAVDALKAAAGDALDFTEIDAAIAALEAAIAGGDLDEMATAGEAVAAAFAGLEAQAEAIAGDDAPSGGVATGGGGTAGNDALPIVLVGFGVLALAGGAYTLRQRNQN